MFWCSAEFTILFSHGNAEDLGCIFDWLHELSYHLKVAYLALTPRAAGSFVTEQVNVLAYDYAGYGQRCACRLLRAVSDSGMQW